MSVVFREGADAHFLGHDGLEQNYEPLLFRSRSMPLSASNHDAHSVDERNVTFKLIENKVAIILGYYEGDKHVAEQLQSIFEQSHQALHVFVSDDQSQPSFTTDEIGVSAEQLAKLSIGIRPNNVGFANNFLNSLASIDDSFEYFAFSDQDDVWHKDKLEKALAVLSKNSSDVPALYCGRTEISNETCTQTLGYSPIFSKPPSFANALIQNLGGGNTMVFNKSARDLIVRSSLNVTVVSHDWWSYQIVTGAGGHVFYDPEPCLKYRQHGNNLVGANTSWAARFVRIRALLQGRLRTWNDIYLKTLLDHKHLLTEQNIRVLNDFIDARQSRLIIRLKLFKRSGIHCQTLFGNLGLLLGILLNKV